MCGCSVVRERPDGAGLQLPRAIRGHMDGARAITESGGADWFHRPHPRGDTARATFDGRRARQLRRASASELQSETAQRAARQYCRARLPGQEGARTFSGLDCRRRTGPLLCHYSPIDRHSLSLPPAPASLALINPPPPASLPPFHNHTYTRPTTHRQRDTLAHLRTPYTLRPFTMQIFVKTRKYQRRHLFASRSC